MPGTFSFYFYIILLVSIWNQQSAMGCRYDFAHAQLVCPTSVATIARTDAVRR